MYKVGVCRNKGRCDPWGNIRVILGYMGIKEKKMDTAITGCIGFRVSGTHVGASKHEVPSL